MHTILFTVYVKPSCRVGCVRSRISGCQVDGTQSISLIMSDRPQTRMVFHFPPPPPGAGAGAYPSPSPSGSNVSARSGQTRNGQFYPSMISPSSQGSTSDSPSIGQSVYNSPGGSPHGGSGYHPETVLSYGMERFAPAKPKEPCDAEGKHVPFEPELVYLTDATGVFQMVEDDQWNKFIDENCAHPLPAHISRFAFPSIINRSLFELISEPKVQHFFRHLMTMVISVVLRFARIRA
ncbi:hypothetical protein M427DRAFT_301461 [Gonapodya prolifera JEL478]|uniref:Uncharacterized protein n=1 Tax=Gonapodya prolifera (strain JEL478) TaxID=1344416 RepID=A0A139AI81_GONPJ|nr:hypothetical protein M427DRAFT_301461 [Gonapodya prolifera JEL478]|eukprot:KXS16133.1 hypothetical protein M427DRAFT_301461 [Gonapodya prolifera JEL478]